MVGDNIASLTSKLNHASQDKEDNAVNNPLFDL